MKTAYFATKIPTMKARRLFFCSSLWKRLIFP